MSFATPVAVVVGRRSVGTAAILILSTVLAACGRPADPSTAGTPAMAPSVPASAPGLASVTGTAPQGTLVSLDPPTPGAFPLPDGPAVMDQLGKQFLPPLLVVRVGQPVEFRNSEDMPHNVYVIRSRVGTEIFNVSTDPYQKYTHTFERSGLYEVACDIHPGMLATIIATETPFTAVAGERGDFTILNVPPGPYTLTVWRAGTDREQTVQIAEPHTEVRLPG